jgi:hypothetical protein
MSSDKATHWFRPKTYGYGAEPANWKGWAATLVFVLAMVGMSLAVFGVTPRATIAWAQWALWGLGVVALTAAFTTVAKRKTDGDIKWRGFDKT